MKFLLSLLLLLVSIPLLPAQEEEGTTRRLRFLPVGDAPPFRQEIRNGVRYELPPPAGSVPPERVQLSWQEEEGPRQEIPLPESQSTGPGLPLRLNHLSPSVEIPAAAGRLHLEAGGDWHQLALPAGDDLLVVLFRDPEEGTWRKARAVRVPEAPNAFRAGDLRFINVAPAPLRIVIGEQEQFELAAGRTEVKSLGYSQGTPTRVGYQDPRRGWQRLWSSALVQNQGERSTIVVYFADGERPRKPLKLVTLRERAQPLPRQRGE
ncbi:hypothetical protein [Roseibacillus ishigakijimensis]|uniref:DUF4397 domain-containing protein n=1 Tax=Roseibacillus ishigakijimensis TaxID=454146 RepID=A0A934RUZ9_9BACT|nr:hypothetical protein [Roseibacillus ishigakijimensis]MBK1834660.1 hypothetical protein [Roseibacillus ishigakijimensis]